MRSIFPSRNFAAVALVSFATVAIFCVWTPPATNAEDAMRDCMPYENAMMCDLNAQYHIPIWQNFFTVVPQKMFDALLLFLFLIAVSATRKNILTRPVEIVKKLRASTNAMLAIVDPIRAALSQGIIRSQVYDSIVG